MGDVIQLDCTTTLDLKTENVLADAAKADLKNVLVIGEMEGGVYIAFSGGDIPLNNWLLDCAKRALLGESFDDGGYDGAA
jgi:hypothetical protein